MSNAVAVMTGLVEFYRARLDEDQKIAEEATPYDRNWNAALYTDGYAQVRSGGYAFLSDDQGFDLSLAGHIARHDPASVLLSVAAHRKILDQYDSWCRLYEERTSHDMARASMGQVLDELERVVLALVQVYAEHPEFRQEWKVG